MTRNEPFLASGAQRDYARCDACRATDGTHHPHCPSDPQKMTRTDRAVIVCSLTVMCILGAWTAWQITS